MVIQRRSIYIDIKSFHQGNDFTSIEMGLR